VTRPGSGAVPIGGESPTVKITLNGEDYEAEEGASVRDLLEALDLARQRVAVLMDGEVVRKAHFREVRLEPESKIDVIHMVGGG